jgi:hypothetical protein
LPEDNVTVPKEIQQGHVADKNGGIEPRQARAPWEAILASSGLPKCAAADRPLKGR